MWHAAFTSAFHGPASQATHWKTAWLLRFPGATCPQWEHRCDVYAADTNSSRPWALCFNRATNRPHPWRLIWRLRPRFCATLVPGHCRLPRVERVIACTFKSSTRMVWKRRAKSVVVFCTQSRRRSASRARTLAMASFVRARRFDPRRARASRCCKRRSRSVSPARRPGTRSRSPVDRATDTATPRSTPTTLPSFGPRTGSGMAAKAMCQRPDRSRVTRYDFTVSGMLRVQRKRTQATLGIHTRPWRRLSRSMWRGLTATWRNPSWVPALRHVGRRWVPLKKLRIAWVKSRNACCWTVCDPAASQSYSARAVVNWAHCSL